MLQVYANEGLTPRMTAIETDVQRHIFWKMASVG